MILPSALITYEASTNIEKRKLLRLPSFVALPALGPEPSLKNVLPLPIRGSPPPSNIAPTAMPINAPNGLPPVAIHPRKPPIHLPIAILYPYFLFFRYF